jgi:hypothetical protein
MAHRCSRRDFLWTAAGAATGGRLLFSQQPPAALAQDAAAPSASIGPDNRPSVVSLMSGESRRKNICESLVAIEDQILPVLQTKKHVVIKPNIVSTNKQIASTHVDAIHGILDFLGPRFKGPVIIAESSAGYTTEGYDNFGYQQVIPDHRPLDVSLVDLNEEGKYETHTILNGDLHAVPCAWPLACSTPMRLSSVPPCSRPTIRWWPRSRSRTWRLVRRCTVLARRSAIGMTSAFSMAACGRRMWTSADRSEHALGWQSTTQYR